MTGLQLVIHCTAFAFLVRKPDPLADGEPEDRNVQTLSRQVINYRYLKLLMWVDLYHE